jgi:hypothetical protein
MAGPCQKRLVAVMACHGYLLPVARLLGTISRRTHPSMSLRPSLVGRRHVAKIEHPGEGMYVETADYGKAASYR